MSHLFLYTCAEGFQSPVNALQPALDKMHAQVAELESHYQFVAVQGLSHTATPMMLDTGSTLRHAKSGYLVTVTAVVEVSDQPLGLLGDDSDANRQNGDSQIGGWT